MTTTEHLQRIRARCVELLAIAENRTPGEWNHVHTSGEDNSVYGVQLEAEINSDRAFNDASFIAACAGPAEAGWRSTIAAIDGLLEVKGLVWPIAPCAALNRIDSSINAIIAAWPEELL